MPDRDARTSPSPEVAPGLADPRRIHPGPEETGPVTGEDPDRDTPAWEGPDPSDDAPEPGMIDPRPEIPGPAGI